MSTQQKSGDPLRVVYEISTLGFGFGNAAEMAGVYRVIVRLLEAARRTPGLQVRFVAETHPLAEIRARAALDELWPGASADLISAWQVPLPPRLHAWLDRRARETKSLPARALRWLGHAFATRSLPREECDVYHSLSYGLPTADIVRPRVRFLTVHDMIPLRFPHFYGTRGPSMREHFAAVAKSARRPLDFVTCNSEATRRDYCDFTRTIPERVFVTPWAAGPEFFPEDNPERLAAAREKYHLPSGPYLLSLCTLEPRKNLPHLIRAFLELVREQPGRDLHLVLAGAKGWGLDETFRAIDGAGEVRARIHCPGRLDDADLAAVYSAAEVFVYPSLYEGFGLPPLEAMQCGVPVITSNTSSLPEVVGDAGLFIDPSDLAALVTAMKSLLDSPELRGAMRERGLQRARQFSWERTVELTVQAYRDALTHADG